MKVPITGIQLLCENNKSSVTRKILTQTEMISQSVERVLFYARLGSVEKDYLITEVPLKACVLEVLAQDKQFLIQNNVCIHTETLCGTVYSDQKWLQFILNQIIIMRSFSMILYVNLSVLSRIDFGNHRRCNFGNTGPQ
jgi:hypothetical protein